MLDFMRRQQSALEVGVGDPDFHIQRDACNALHPIRRSAERQYH